MPVVEARIDTDRPSRYLVQFCKHAAAMGSRGHAARLHRGGAQPGVTVAADWSDTHGTVTFTPWGVCTLTAGPGSLTVRVDAATDDGLARIRDIVTRNLERFTRRNPVTVAWLPSPDPGAAPLSHSDTEPSGSRRRPVRRVVLAASVVVLAV